MAAASAKPPDEVARARGPGRTPARARAAGLGLALLAALGAACGDDDGVGARDGGPDAPFDVDGALPDGGPPAPYEIPDCPEPPEARFSPLRPRCGMFADDEGRTVLLRGVNARVEGLFDVTFDDGRVALEPIPDFTDDDARRMRALGFNFLRLPVNWSGLEPRDATPRAFLASYVARLREVLDVCRAHDVFVLVDWHQDAYSKEIGEDGAPLWAISPPPAMLLEGPLEDLEARRTSPQVLAAFATFFGDAEPGPTLRARFTEAVVHVVEALRGDDAVVGFEIYNEPVATDAQTRRLNEAVAAAIVAADPARLSFFEPPALPRNFTDRAALAETPFAVAGGVYAPHSYTLAFNGTEAQRLRFTRETLRTSHRNAVREAESWGTPLLIGEWGYDPRGIRAEEYYRLSVELMDEYGESWAFWVWKEDSQGSWGVHDFDRDGGVWRERALLVRSLSRPRPERIAGWPRRFGFDAEAGVLEVRFRGEAAVTAPNEVYLPERAPAAVRVTCDGVAIAGLRRDTRTGLLAVPCGGVGEHVLRVEGLTGL
jgi:endoglycosylceramidase